MEHTNWFLSNVYISLSTKLHIAKFLQIALFESFEVILHNLQKILLLCLISSSWIEVLDKFHAMLSDI